MDLTSHPWPFTSPSAPAPYHTSPASLWWRQASSSLLACTCSVRYLNTLPWTSTWFPHCLQVPAQMPPFQRRRLLHCPPLLPSDSAKSLFPALAWHTLHTTADCPSQFSQKTGRLPGPGSTSVLLSAVFSTQASASGHPDAEKYQVSITLLTPISRQPLSHLASQTDESSFKGEWDAWILTLIPWYQGTILIRYYKGRICFNKVKWTFTSQQ